MNLRLFTTALRRSRCVRLAMLLAAVAWLKTTLLAIDPLPPDIEKASLEVQLVYRERLAREGLEEKIAIGKKRYNERQRYQENLVASLRREAQVREEAIYSQIESQITPVDTTVPSPITFFNKLPLLCIVGVFSYMASSRVIKRLWYGESAPAKNRPRHVSLRQPTILTSRAFRPHPPKLNIKIR